MILGPRAIANVKGLGFYRFLGTGGGMPGLIVAIVMKKLKNQMKINLYEKSYHKCIFLKEV